jgi:hypothetical protein
MTEHKQLNAWMKRNGLDRHVLADMTGWTAQSIYWYCRGTTPAGKNREAGVEIKPWAWNRFRRACGDVDAEMNGRKKGGRFEW